jgi:hypothetical protein
VLDLGENFVDAIHRLSTTRISEIQQENKEWTEAQKEIKSVIKENLELTESRKEHHATVGETFKACVDYVKEIIHGTPGENVESETWQDSPENLEQTSRAEQVSQEQDKLATKTNEQF